MLFNEIVFYQTPPCYLLKIAFCQILHCCPLKIVFCVNYTLLSTKDSILSNSTLLSTENQKLACFVLYFKIVDTCLKNDSKLSKELKNGNEILVG